MSQTHHSVLGAKLLEEFRPVLLLFAGLLVYSSYKVLFGEDEARSSRISFSSVGLGFMAEPAADPAALASCITSQDDEEEDLEQNPVVKLARKLVKVSSSYDGNKFFTEVDGAGVGRLHFV